MKPPSSVRFEVSGARRREPLRLLVLAPLRPPAGMLADRRVLAIGSIHAVGLAAAAIWLFARIASRLHGVGFHVDAAEILRELRAGPEFYVFAGIAMLGSVLLLVAARPWVEARDSDPHTGTHHAGTHPTGMHNAAGRPTSGPVAGSHGRVDRGRGWTGTDALAFWRYRSGWVKDARPCRPWESTLVQWWIIFAIAAPAIILLLVFPLHGPAVRLALWGYAAVSAALSIGAAVRARGVRIRR